jgi:hypothetical protein
MPNNFAGEGGCVAVYNFESLPEASPILISASSEYSSTYSAFWAFSTSNNYWRTTTAGALPCWISIDLGTERSCVITSYLIRSSSAGNGESAPKAWTFEGWNGSSWVTIDSQTNQTAWGYLANRTFEFDNSTAYSKYRFVITENNGSTTVQIALIRLYNVNSSNMVGVDCRDNTLSSVKIVDSKNTNHLYGCGVSEAPSRDTTNFKQGTSSVDLEKSNHNAIGITGDDKLSSSFPLKYGTTNYTVSFTLWLRLESQPPFAYQALILILRYNDASDYMGLALYNGNTYNGFRFKIKSDKTFFGPSSTVTPQITSGNWYFVACGWDHTNRKTRMYVWDPVTESALADDETTYNLNTYGTPIISDYGFYLGSSKAYNSGDSTYWDGNLDEVTVWNRALTKDEIEQIRDGIFGPSWELSFTETNELSIEISSAALTPTGSPVWPLFEILSWKTDILRPLSTSKEQRVALRRYPRQAYRGSMLLLNMDERTRVENLLHERLKAGVWMPLWHDRRVLSDGVEADAGYLGIDESTADFRSGEYAIIYKSELECELVRIEGAASGGGLYITGPAVAYEGPVVVAPVRKATFVAPVTFTPLEDDSQLMEFAVVFSNSSYVSGHVAGQTYAGLEVLSWPSLEFDGRNHEMDPDYTLVDNGIGAVSTLDYTEFNITRQSHTFHIQGNDDCWAFRKFLHAMRGSQKTFLVPTWEDDLILTQALGSGSVTAYVQYAGLAAHLKVNALRKYVACRTPAGGVAVATISSIVVASGKEESLTLSAPLGVSLSAGTSLMFVDKCRFADDEIVLEWYQPDDLVCRTALVRVEQ